MLNERKNEILKLIYNSEMDLEQIAIILNVSSRTIRRDLINIGEVIGSMGYSLEKDKTKYKIIDNDGMLFQKLNKQSSNALINEERNLVAFRSIIIGEDEINLELIANELYTSVQSVKTQVCKFLEEYNVTYNIKGLKVSIEQTDIARRELIVVLLRDYLRTIDINSLVLEASLDSSMIRNNHLVDSYLDRSLFHKQFINIENIFNDTNKYITDFQLIMIVITICASERQSNLNRLSSFDTTIVSNTIIEKIIKQSTIDNEAECVYLRKKLDTIITELEYEKVNLALVSEINGAITEVEHKLGIEFLNKRKLEYQICTHKVRAYNNSGDIRLTNNISLFGFVEENSMLYDIIKSVDKLYKNDDENLQYLLIYFVMALEETLSASQWQIYVICFGGMGTSLMIKKQLEKEYPNSTIQNLSYARALSSNHEEADVIISNYKLPSDLQDLVVGHIVTKDNVKQINSLLLKKNKKSIQTPKPLEIQYNIGYKSTTMDYDALTVDILNYYESNGQIKNSEYVFQKLKKRESVGVGIPDSTIAFFHTRSSSINSLLVATYDIDQIEAIGFDGIKMECNKILLVLVPIDITDELLYKVNILSYSLISDGELIDAILSDDQYAISNIMN